MLKVNGFTLIELLISLTIVGILTSLVAPSFANLIASNKMVAQHNSLVAAISLTRSEAIKRSQRVSICQSSDSLSCTKNSTRWHDGWVVYVDSDEDNQIDAGEPVLRIQQATDINISFGARTRIAYHPDGLAVGGSNGTILFCDYRGDDGKKGLIISTTGRIRKAQKIDLNAKHCS
jgi:type IV fimbrial biogenesis protein FimT